jgi:predicted lipoprotein with Yx(FWY)xxD motif
MKIRSTAILATLLLAPAGLGACGSTTPSSTATSTPTSTAPPVASAASPSPSAPAAAATTPVLTAATAMVGGKSLTVLTDTQGLTLYYRSSDTPTNVCSAGCAGAWPPLLLSQGTPGSSSPVPGTLATIADANGRQVTYNAHPLYRFASDSGPGSTKGDGVLGVWFVATLGLP